MMQFAVTGKPASERTSAAHASVVHGFGAGAGVSVPYVPVELATGTSSPRSDSPES